MEPTSETQMPTENQGGPDITVQPAAKRGRGRPPKNPQPSPDGSAAGPEKETIPGAAAAKPRKTKSSGKIDVNAIANQLVGLHQLAFIASGQQFPEMVIQPQEGMILAQGICAVCEQYDLSIDGKTGAFLQLAGACAMVYAPRIIEVRRRMAAQRPVDTTAREVPQNPGA